MGDGRQDGGVRLLHAVGDGDGAARTFDAVLGYMEGARESVEIHMYVWRSDEIGNRIGEAVLAAAERGVKVRIIKDTGAFMFERTEMNRKSFFNREIPGIKTLAYRMVGRTFPDTFVEDEYGFELGERVMAHENVEMQWVNKTHTKYYVIDERVLITGSVNIEDRHRGYYDYMIAMEGEGAVERFRDRFAGRVARDPSRTVDFLCNAHRAGVKEFEIKEEILRQLKAARESVFVEMAYIGDEDVTRAIVETARRGVRVVFLLSEEANIGNDLNYRTMHRIYERAPVEVYLTPKMIHSKLMLFDEALVVMGSCNLSVFSMEKAGELDVVIRDEPELVTAIDAVLKSRMAASRKVEAVAELRGYSGRIAALQQWHQKVNPN